MLAVDSETPFAAHVQSHTVVLPRERVLFLPMPKSACTSVLWALAEMAGMTPDDFEGSTMPEPSAALTVHDMNAWAPDHRLTRYEGEERRRILEGDGWLRFTVVRDPWRRLWSGWLSKLLLREPRFVADHGGQPWFPRMPERAGDVVEDFRRFVAALGAGEGEDVHWAVQHDLSAQLPLTHVGRAERLGDALRLLHEHVGGEPAPPSRRNESPLTLPPHAYDEASAQIVRRRFAADFDAFGYDDRAAARRLAGRVGRRGRGRAAAAARDDRPARARRAAAPPRAAARRAHAERRGAARGAPGALAGHDQPRGSRRLQRALGLGGGHAASRA